MRASLCWLALCLCLAQPILHAANQANFLPAKLAVPAVPREFRGVWIASVSNIDWPSKPGLPAAEQQRELRTLLDFAAKTGLNAVILQMRPACDALYPSKLEPWSEYLTGQMGKPPEPYYDPLAFAVAEAHQRGLELHAWFNPYRARQSGAKSSVSPDHISRTRPEFVKKYGNYLWLDPAEPAVQEHSLKVIMDVVRRYDIDGVHIDDYFYPYKVKDEQGKTVDFPDQASWSRYQKSGGKLARDDWRRDNVNGFVERLYRSIKVEKRWVKFGISPFGIWRPGFPREIKGLDAYQELYADSKKWLEQGWCDYFSPQLYWGVSETAQSYPLLLDWWAGVNKHGRHLWPGNNLDKIGAKWPLSDFELQLQITRKQGGTSGNVLWHSKPLMANQGKVADLLQTKLYSNLALPPASPWLSSTHPAQPKLNVQKPAQGNGLTLSWAAQAGQPIQLWVLQTRRNRQAWDCEILPGPTLQHEVISGTGREVDAISLVAVDRFGQSSPPMVLERTAKK